MPRACRIRIASDGVRGAADTVRGVVLVALVLVGSLWAAGQESQPPAPANGSGPEAASAPPASDTANQASPAATSGADPASVSPKSGQLPPLTLWVMLQEGGPILWVINILSVLAVAMVVYLLLTVTPSREAPPLLMKRAVAQIRAGDLRGAYQMCEERDEILAKVIRAGVRVSGHDRYVIQEAMESEGERAATALWQRITYLNNIGHIAPLLGLLGTVWGMILSFWSIAADDSQVKSINMAHGVAMAMITTVAGLLVAIPVMCVYFYLRGRVIKVMAAVEAQASEILELLTKPHE